MTPAASPQVVLLDAAPARTQEVADLLDRRGVKTIRVQPGPAMNEGAFATATAALCVLDDCSRQIDQVKSALHRLTESKVATLVWGLDPNSRLAANPFVQAVKPDASLDEIAGRLAALTHIAPLFREMDSEIRDLTRLSRQLDRYFGEVDQEMRLAGRLQRDFMPRVIPKAPPLTFATLFRPASWVSGDIYDIILLDPRRVALFIADAMGHGTAAALMTMFLRQSLKTRAGVSAQSKLLSPMEAIGGFNECIARQKLPDCQFVTAAYGIIDLDTLSFTVARGGHPYPLLVAADGTPTEISPVGGLLGIADLVADFEEQTVTLRPGEKLIYYTDGVEELFIAGREDDSRRTIYTPQLTAWTKLSGQEFVDAVRNHLDHQEGSLHPADDVTVLVAEVAK
ncbi:MAG: PP2C family protein-serine/threonine phosphatase [Phycisphaerae bacterium]